MHSSVNPAAPGQVGKHSAAAVAPPALAVRTAYFPALDGLRAIAFLMVFAIHYLSVPWGWTGVNVFFVLSGFLITGILYDTRDKPHRVYNFYLRRTLRIFPLYYGIMLLLVLVYPVFRWQWSWAWLIWPAYLGNFLRYIPTTSHSTAFMLLNFAAPISRTYPRIQLYFGHFWSLCVEEQFYLVWPWVVFSIKDRRTLLRLCVVSVIVIPFLRIWAEHALPQSALANAAVITATPLPFDALFLGGLLALLRRGPWADRLLPFARKLFVALAVAILLCLAYRLIVFRSADAFLHPSWAFTFGPCVVDVLTACLIVMAIERDSLTFRLFHLAPLRWLGRISYGAYVFHDILHVEFLRVVSHFTLRPAYPTAALALIVTLICAWASFQWFETPFIRLKERWTIPTPTA